MTDTRPVLLLDIDGVLNAISRTNPAIWPVDTWRAETVLSNGFGWPIRWSTKVVDFINEIADDEVEIRWHTTWQHEAQNIADALGLPVFTVAEAPEFHLKHKSWDWWKMNTALRVVNEEERILIWLDDDLVVSSEVTLFFKKKENFELPTLLIDPDTTTGLSPVEIEDIRDFLKEI